jgi:large subunit ribosomal protein L29
MLWHKEQDVMKIKEIKEKASEALEHELKDKQKHLFDLRTQAVTEKLEDPTQLGKTRKEIARIKTVLHQRQLEAAQPKATEPAK